MDDRTQLIDRKQAAKYAGVAPVTMWRWMTKGVLDAFGRQVRLRRQRRGGTLYTTRQWVDDFFDELSRADDAKWDEVAGKSTSSRNEEIRQAAMRVTARTGVSVGVSSGVRGDSSHPREMDNAPVLRYGAELLSDCM